MKAFLNEVDPEKNSKGKMAWYLIYDPICKSETF